MNYNHSRIVFIRDSNLKSVSSTLRDFKSDKKNKIDTDKSNKNKGKEAANAAIELLIGDN